jgi:phenylacetate-CoA ligase
MVSKDDIRREPEAFIAVGYDKSDLILGETSGTTGSPLSVYADAKAYQTEMAFRWRHRAWAGLALGARGAYVSGHPVVPPTQRRAPFWRVDHAERRLLMSSYHLRAETIPAYLKAIETFRPDFLHGYPSSLALLAAGVTESGIAPRVRAIISASETLLPFQREVIERAFGTKVYNWYGQTEMTCNIVECREGRLHLRTDYGYLEVDDEGVMIGTGLNNRAMPLVRYRTSDRVQLKTGVCGCGCAFPLVARLEGRTEDYIVTRDGFLVGRLDHIFKGAHGVREAQVVQTEPGRVVLRVARGPGFDQNTVSAIRREAVQRLGPTTHVVFDFVDRIERGPGGKFRFIVSQIRPIDSRTKEAL